MDFLVVLGILVFFFLVFFLGRGVWVFFGEERRWVWVVWGVVGGFEVLWVFEVFGWRSSLRSSTTCMRCVFWYGHGILRFDHREVVSGGRHPVTHRADAHVEQGLRSSQIEWRNWARQCGALQG